MGKYFLISNKVGQNFAQYRGNALRLTQSSLEPTFVDEIVVGIRGDKNFRRKITVFRDDKWNPIEKVFDYSDKSVLRNRVYSHESNFIGNDEFVTSTNIKEFTLDKNIISVAKQKKVQEFGVINVLYDFISSVSNHFSENSKTGETILSQITVRESFAIRNVSETFEWRYRQRSNGLAHVSVTSRLRRTAFSIKEI